jgi:putative alpha-1,2-mannosidase
MPWPRLATITGTATCSGSARFEVEEAYAFMKQGALTRDGGEECQALGWCPADRMSKAVARALEYAWADASIANLAEALGYAEDSAQFRERAGAWRHTWNPATRFFQPRNADGSFQEPFYPDRLTFIDDALHGGRYLDDYVEGSPRCAMRPLREGERSASGWAPSLPPEAASRARE